jgi:A/G-specific adenine glycosylase
MTAATRPFAARLLRWFDRHGRHDLPWQHPRTPYRVWLSEVMLQQTQVATVIPYFRRFVRALPTLAKLARAPADEVLALWSGLGYYSRARNLQRAAQACVERHRGALPETMDELAALPGIGRSTAAAILAQAHGQRHAILDGNVKRVLSRHAGVRGDVAGPAVSRRLWTLAEALLPHKRLPDYTQALMDLGATVCTRRKPDCARCPVARDCVALRDGLIELLPERKAARPVPSRRVVVLMLRDAGGRVLLERRPPTGVWGGLWSVPEFAPGEDVRTGSRERYGLATAKPRAAPGFAHRFTHFRLDADALCASVQSASHAIADNDGLRWVDAHELDGIGLPAPIRTLLSRTFQEESDAPHRLLPQAPA